MNILIIKQTSLGDVLHSTGHVRLIRQQYPNATLVLLTDQRAAPIYRANPHLDEIILFDRYGVKSDWWRRPMAVFGHIREVMRQVRQRQFDLVIDLQGRWKSVMFLYAARARRRVVKGRWWFVESFRDRNLHAITEMDRVLEVAGIVGGDTSMEFPVPDEARARIDSLLSQLPEGIDRFMVASPFTRWPTKDWPLQHYVDLSTRLPRDMVCLMTGTADVRQRIEAQLSQSGNAPVINMAGQLAIDELAELIRRAHVAVSGDSFASHVACAVKTPVVTLFGPTDENKVGPTGENCQVIRAADCHACYRRTNCPGNCMERISVEEVWRSIAPVLS